MNENTQPNLRRCGLCREVGHNRRTCPMPMVPEEQEDLNAAVVRGRNAALGIRQRIHAQVIHQRDQNAAGIRQLIHERRAERQRGEEREGEIEGEVIMLRRMMTVAAQRLVSAERSERAALIAERAALDIALIAERAVRAAPMKPNPKIRIQMEDDDTSFVKEKDCVCCMNPLNMGSIVAFGCNHVTCAECAPKVIKMVAANCPICREKITTIKFMRDMPSTTYNTLFSAVM